MEKINYQNLPVWVLILLSFWALFWKGWALWKASQKRQLLWFVIILIFNTLGLLEIAYIFYLNRFNLNKEGKLLFFLKNWKKSKRKKKQK